MVYLQRRPQVFSALDVLLEGRQKGLVVSISSVLGLRNRKNTEGKQNEKKRVCCYAYRNPLFITAGNSEQVIFRRSSGANVAGDQSG